MGAYPGPRGRRQSRLMSIRSTSDALVLGILGIRVDDAKRLVAARQASLRRTVALNRPKTAETARHLLAAAEAALARAEAEYAAQVSKDVQAG